MHTHTHTFTHTFTHTPIVNVLRETGKNATKGTAKKLSYWKEKPEQKPWQKNPREGKERKEQGPLRRFRVQTGGAETETPELSERTVFSQTTGQ